MTQCRNLYHQKDVLYKTKTVNKDDISYVSMKRILANKNIVVDMKGETVTDSVINVTKFVSDKKETLRKRGSVKIERNCDKNLIDYHSNLISASLGQVFPCTEGSFTVTAGKGSVATPFLTADTSKIAAGCLVFISGIGFRRVESIVTNTSFVVDKPLYTALSVNTTFKSKTAVMISKPIGSCSYYFDVVVRNSDLGKDDVFLSCTPRAELSLVFTGNQKITFNFEAAKCDERESTSLTTPVDEPSTPMVKTDFEESVFTLYPGTAIEDFLSIFPQNFDLGLAITAEPQDYTGGLNNRDGGLLRSDINPKFTFDRVAEVYDPSDITSSLVSQVNCIYSAYQEEGIGIYFPNISSFYENDFTVANSNHDSIVTMANVNDTSNHVFICLP